MPPRRRSASGGESEGQRVRISPTDVDPLASLRISKIQVSLADRSWLIPAHDAAVWLEILLDEELDPEAIFPGLCDPDVIIEVNDLMIMGTITVADMEAALYDVIEAASGRRWWVALRLCRTIRAGWDRIGGELASHGVTPWGVSLSYWLDGAFATICRILRDDPKALSRFTAQLTQPPPGLAKEEFERKRPQAVEAFKAAMNRAKSGR